MDLRDGIRLARIIFVLSGKDVSRNLRFPAIGKTHRIHNLRIVLEAIKEEGIGLAISTGEAVTARDIETGNREKTLFLLWQIIGYWRLPRYLDNICLDGEISSLRHVVELRGETVPSIKVTTPYFPLKQPELIFAG
jgi:hypothetical protein